MSNIIRNRAATNPAAKATDQDTQRTPPTLLAQIPDLDATHPPARVENPGDGRILNQALSVRLLLGGGAVLVMLALMASFWNRATRPAVVTELPAWHGAAGANSAPTANLNAPAFTANAPAPTTKAIAEARHEDSATHTALVQAQTPARTPPAPAMPTAPAPLQVARPADSNPAERTNYRNYDRPASGVYQADSRNDAAAGYRPAGGYDLRDHDNTAMRNANGSAANNAPASNNGPANGLPNNTGYPGRNDVNPATGAQYLPPVNGPSRTEFAPPISYPPAGAYRPQGNPQPQTNYPPAGSYPQNDYPQNNYQPNNAPNAGGYGPTQGSPYGQQYAPNNGQYGPNNGQGTDAGAARLDGTINNSPANYSR